MGRFIFSENLITPSLEKMSLVFTDDFTHILRVLNTNVDGRQNIQFALTKIRGVGRRMSNIVCKKSEINIKKRAGEMTTEDIENMLAILSNPQAFKVPHYFLNRKRDFKDGLSCQAVSNNLDTKLRDDL